MIKTCPKCQEQFECCANDISNCHCVNVVLDANAIEQLKKQYQDCLCHECLKEMATKKQPYSV